MLAEILAWILTPATLDARRTGHLAAAVSLWSRAGRCRHAWRPHEERCRAVVERALADLRQRRTCVVLGSGLLRDIDLPRLAASFETVILVDVVHLWPARLAARRRGNVRLLSLDITGTTDLLLGRATGLAAPLSRFAADPTIDLVISANCLSQLALLPVARVEARGDVWARRVPDLGRRIVADHLAALRRFSCRVVLLTDSEGIESDAAGREIDRYDLLEGVELPAADDDWEWPLAPLGEGGTGRVIRHRAHGFVDFHAATARGRRGRPSGSR